ncbi:MAG: tail fiber domain-containing protein [Alphaproteobacteria bacterium]|nr:MAG: tail fiber domain-containing protein [Alphaproteobacteria bacterium]
MSKATIAAVTVLSLFLSACSTSGGGMSSGNNTPGSYCYEHTTVCVVGGVIVAGAIAAVIIHNNNDDDNGPPPGPSDQRLKRDIKPLTVTDNGIKVYSFRYLGDDRMFSGVLAQDLLQDPETADAVSKDENGYYSVDYAKLGLPVVNEDAMLEAGLNAEKIVMGQAYQQ